MSKYAYTLLEIGGIQKYILQTGKLKEMIGGSEMIASLGSESDAVCEEMHLRSVTEPEETASGWYIVLQQAAGTLRFLFASQEDSRSFLQKFGARILELCPGLPLYGATVECAWTAEGLQQAARDAKDRVNEKRSRGALPPKQLWPFSRMAPLDGLPAVGRDDEYVSQPSMARRKRMLLDKAEVRLREKTDSALHELADKDGNSVLPPDVKTRWVTDMDELMRGTDLPRVALLHMDGNSMGRLFRNCLTESKSSGPGKQIQRVKELSNTVEACTQEAFRQALCHIVALDIARTKRLAPVYIVPARPLVLGGDDLTVIVRSDLAFAFADRYAEAFENAAKTRGRDMSVGGGMVIMAPGYPFSRAFDLCEQLTESAKALTEKHTPEGQHRPSSLDYIVLTNDVGQDVVALRQNTLLTEDGHSLTGKPFLCGTGRGNFHPTLRDVLIDARIVLDSLSASQLRDAMEESRSGLANSDKAWRKIHENLRRGIGGRKNTPVHSAAASFESIFPDSFFLSESGRRYTLLGDYIELRHLGLFPAKESE